MTTESPTGDGVSLFERPPSYRSYVLRFWQERSEQLPQIVWRFSLEDPLTGQRSGFPSLEALTGWLDAEMKRAEGGRANTPGEAIT